jgi:hypothetical protein
MPSLRALMAALLAARCCGGGTASSDSATQRVYRASLAAGSGVSLITDDTDTRAYVREVVEGSTADVAGLSIEDELLSVGGLVVAGRAGSALEDVQAEVQREPELERVWSLRRPVRRMQTAAATDRASWLSDLHSSGGMANVAPANFEEGRGLAPTRDVEAGELLVWIPESMAFKAEGENLLEGGGGGGGGGGAPSSVVSLASQLLGKETAFLHHAF